MLTLALSLPDPVFAFPASALRPRAGGLEERTELTNQIERRLRGGLEEWREIREIIREARKEAPTPESIEVILNVLGTAPPRLQQTAHTTLQRWIREFYYREVFSGMNQAKILFPVVQTIANNVVSTHS